MICPNCQTKNQEGAKFCFNCGHALATLAAAPDPEADLLARMADKPRGDQSQIQRFIPSDVQAKLESARAAQQMEGERRIVTILFGDIAGSTAAAEQLDPEVWTEIMNGAFEHLISPIYRYEGTAARLMGDAILAFFGAPIVQPASMSFLSAVWLELGFVQLTLGQVDLAADYFEKSLYNLQTAAKKLQVTAG